MYNWWICNIISGCLCSGAVLLPAAAESGQHPGAVPEADAAGPANGRAAGKGAVPFESATAKHTQNAHRRLEREHLQLRTEGQGPGPADGRRGRRGGRSGRRGRQVRRSRRPVPHLQSRPAQLQAPPALHQELQASLRMTSCFVILASQEYLHLSE